VDGRCLLGGERSGGAMRRGGGRPATSSRLFGEARCVTDQLNFRDRYGQHAGSTGRIAFFSSLGLRSKPSSRPCDGRQTNGAVSVRYLFPSDYDRECLPFDFGRDRQAGRQRNLFAPVNNSCQVRKQGCL
jgi:hypothetical protein